MVITRRFFPSSSCTSPIPQLPTLSIPNRITICRSNSRSRLEKLAEVLTSIALPIRKQKASGRVWVLCETRAACELLALRAARGGVRSDHFVGCGSIAATGVVYLENALVAVGVIDDVVGSAGGVRGGGGGDDGHSLRYCVGGC